MDNILEPNENFDFSLVSLGQPNSIQGGAYFTKLQFKEKPLYIETPQSLTRQGFVKNGKKMVVDLMFDNTNEEFIHWLENLEIRCQQLIYSKGDTWFQNKLEMNDIETAFNSPLKVYKSGKFYLVRVNVKMNYTSNNPYVKIFNENEIPLTIDDVNTDTSVVSVLEIQGIKFTTRSFQIEMEVKQMMILNTYEIFENCVIKHKSKTDKKLNDTCDLDCSIKQTNDENIQFETNTTLDYSEPLNETTEQSEISELFLENDKTEKQILHSEEFLNTIKLSPLDENDLTEVNIDDIDNLETIQLKKPNQVYYEIYKEARKKAKEAKKNAMIAFLEAKNIKKTYMLEDLDDSDDSSMENYSEDEYEKDGNAENM